MSTLTSLLGLHQAVGSDNARDYLKTNLAADLAVLDEAVLANAVSTHISASKAFDVGQDFKQIATPGTNPAAGYDRVYVKSDDNLYVLTSAGVERGVGGVQAFTTLTNNATLALPNAGGYTRLNVIYSGTTTVTNFSNVPAAGVELVLSFTAACKFSNGNHIKLMGSNDFYTDSHAWIRMISDGTDMYEMPGSRGWGTAGVITAALGADSSAFALNTWTDSGISLAMTVGYWNVGTFATLFDGTGNTQHYLSIRLQDTTNTATKAVQGGTMTAAVGADYQFSIPSIQLTVATAYTLKLQGVSQSSASTLFRAASTANGSGNLNTQITAVRYA